LKNKPKKNKFFEDLKKGLEEILAYQEGKIAIKSKSTEIEDPKKMPKKTKKKLPQEPSHFKCSCHCATCEEYFYFIVTKPCKCEWAKKDYEDNFLIVRSGDCYLKTYEEFKEHAESDEEV
jgi:hypothetical protein